MRWDATVDLVHRVRERAADGSFPPAQDVVTTVFCNRNTVGHNTLVGWTETSIKPVAAVQVHSSDYDDQAIAILDGKEYSVERVSRRGDFTTLTLGRMGRNV